ncbi:MAG TPA: hypothetical protein PK760_07700, partial [Flavobacteriales bacterium]|nr:hypothetical protein [Flavobacteriales bacterium]
ELGRASTYEREGMYQEAFDRYSTLYAARPKMVDAHVGMKRSAQALFDRLQDEASAAYAMHDLATGDAARSRAVTFKSRMDPQGLDIQWMPLFEQKRSEAVRYEVDRLYGEAEEAFKQEHFTQAEELANQCHRLDPDRRDAEHLAKLAQVEPIYREALLGMELGLWREAYQKFKHVAELDAGHKDTMVRLATCREKAQVMVCYIPVVNSALYNDVVGALYSYGQLETQLAANMKQALMDLNDPLLVLVDRDHTDQIIEEQRRQMSGAYDDRHLIEAGKLLGARYVLTAKILRYDDVLRRETEVQVQLLDAETGRIRSSEIVRANKQEIARGNTRSQLMELVAKRGAEKLRGFAP